ncbi:GH32 C-terminal domain-containing protein [uncultured Oscillibacter sp.]|uniref:GH32 C-terminal domain-containing protein n=1 Tax=uncultured Oscillibacter sp. TaxID=876091 RepID=UPI0034A05273
MEAYRTRRVVHQNIPVCGEINLPGVRGRVLDMTVSVRPTGSERYRWFRIRVAKDGEHETIIRYRPDQGTVKLDRIRSGLPRDIVHTRSFLVRPGDGEIKLRIVLDRYSLEVFANDGEQAASAVIYTRQEADAITFEAGGAAMMDVEKYDLDFDRQEA